MPSVLEMIWRAVCVLARECLVWKKADDRDLWRKTAQIPGDFRPCREDGGFTIREASKTDSDVKSEPVCDVIDYDGCFSEGDEGIWGGMWEQEVLIKEGGELSPWSSHSLMLTLTQSHVLPHKHSVHKQIQLYTFMNS